MAKPPKRFAARRPDDVRHHARLALRQPEMASAATPLQHGRDRRERRREAAASRARSRTRSPCAASRRPPRRMDGRALRRRDRAGRRSRAQGRADRGRRRRAARAATPRSRALAKLKPGVPRRTARSRPATRRGINDGAAALLVIVAASDAEAHRAASRWRAIVARRVAGVDPALHGHRPGAGHAQGAGARRADRRATST